MCPEQADAGSSATWINQLWLTEDKELEMNIKIHYTQNREEITSEWEKSTCKYLDMISEQFLWPGHRS